MARRSKGTLKIYRAKRESLFYDKISKTIKQNGGAQLGPRPCGKRCYKSRTLAKSTIRQISLSNNVDTNKVGVLTPYYCDDCAAWHVGHDRWTKKS